MKVYDGSQPATPATGITSQNLLVTLTFSATAFGPSSTGVATANAITAGTAGATGTAAWARLASGAGTVIMDMSVGPTGSFDIQLSTATINSGNSVSLSSFTLTHPQ